MKTQIFVIMVAALLAACGGGGGGGGGDPSVSTRTCSDGSTILLTETCPNRNVEGTRDSFFMANCTGDCYRDLNGNLADIRESRGSVYPNGVPFLHRRVEGPTDFDPAIRVPGPPRDVREAWRAGWTGNGVNILIMDSFGVPGQRPVGDRGTHGYTVSMAALEIAPNAVFSALEAGLSGEGTNYRQGGVQGAGGQTTRFEVINWSFGPESFGRIPSASEEAEYQRLPVFQDVLGSAYLTHTADAVITVAAGNDSTDAGHRVSVTALVNHESTGPRVLVVGALDFYGRATDPQDQDSVSTEAELADYSAFAGNTRAVQNRFLVEYGGTPYGERAFLCDADLAGSDGCRNPQIVDRGNDRLVGTSFAAPRVAGFAALVRHKFPNLSGRQTADVLLDTATFEGLTTEGLVCHPNCDLNVVFGQGRVDIGRALAPIGTLQ